MKHRIRYDRHHPRYPEIIVFGDSYDTNPDDFFIFDNVKMGESAKTFKRRCAGWCFQTETLRYVNYIVENFDKIQKEFKKIYIKENL